ncbi:MAG: hypothetical protein K8E66_13735, partial [Phycisphaerales bacterium]|nr:hypothetical protein [Phycisphaerales bacterium]
MTHRELLESALLDALSLLDEEEREAFNEAFEAAPPHLQAQVRREQTRLARMESLLPDVVPPAALRARVIEAVRAAIAGRQLAEAERVLKLHDPDTISRLPAVAHRRKVAAVWRAIALGCATAAIVFGLLLFQLSGLYDETQSLEDRMYGTLTDRFGPDITDVLIDADTRRITLTSSDFGSEAQAAIWT